MLAQFNEFMTAHLGPFGPIIAVGVVGLFMVLLTLPVLLNKQEDPLDKLKKCERMRAKGQSPEDRLRASSGPDKLEKYSDFLEPKDEEEYSAIKLKLLQAGYRGKNSVRTYHFAQFALGGGGLIIGILYAILLTSTNDDVSTQQVVISILLPGLICECRMNSPQKCRSKNPQFAC
jgi:tight adherence protein C